MHCYVEKLGILSPIVAGMDSGWGRLPSEINQTVNTDVRDTYIFDSD